MIASALALRGPIDREPDFRVRVHMAAGWLNSNDRAHWSSRHGPVKAWRDAAGWAAKLAKVPPLGRAYILAEFGFTDARRRDPANWYPTVKACVDGLVDVGVLVDDSADYLLGPDLRVGPKVVGRISTLTLHLWRLP